MKSFIKFTLSAVLSLTTSVPAFAAGERQECYQPVTKPCDEAGLSAAASVNNGANIVANNGEQNISNQAANVGSVTGAGAANFASAAAICEEQKKKCEKSCTQITDQNQRKKKQQACVAYLAGKINEYNTNAAGFQDQSRQAHETSKAAGSDSGSNSNPGSNSGGMGGMGPALMGALAGGLLGYMLGKKQGEKDKDRDLEIIDATGALQPNGTIDCSKPDAYQYSDCNAYLAQVCKNKMNSNTYANDANCQNFAGRYCGGAAAATTPPAGSQVDLGDGGVSTMTAMTPPIGPTGEGLTADPGFCQAVLAHNYCKTSGRDQCPSCLQIQKNQSPACAADPTLCMAQNSPEQINQAKTSCPTDPIFSNPAYTQGGSAVATKLDPGGNLPVVQLPSTGSSADPNTTGTQTTVANGSGVSTFSMQSAKGSAGGNAADGAAREGVATGPGSQASYGGSGSGVSAASGVRPWGANGRDVAAVTGGSAGPNGGPAPDVQGQFGPSLFATGTQVLKQRCQAGKLNNCP